MFGVLTCRCRRCLSGPRRELADGACRAVDLVLYVGVYTPLKARSAANTVGGRDRRGAACADGLDGGRTPSRYRPAG